DVGVEAVQGLLAGCGHGAQIAKIQVVERDAVVHDVYGAPLEEAPTAAQHVVARADPHGAAIETAELLIAGHEILKARTRKQIGVEFGGRLRVEPQPRLEYPAAVA